MATWKPDYICHFYPRSPCGERPLKGYRPARTNKISIHALLAESDGIASPSRVMRDISIHALLAESDRRCPATGQTASHFYPRSPCGERRKYHRADRVRACISIHALLAESDLRHCTTYLNCSRFLSTLSLRRATFDTLSALAPKQFLSTLSLRRATALGLPGWLRTLISIHALLAESDHYDNYNLHCTEISIHALLAESDFTCARRFKIVYNFYPRSPCGERPPY